MEFRDLIVTPLVALSVLMIAYIVAPYLTDPITRRYFFAALSVKIVGAILLGLLYQFYYYGGDTFNFHTYGSRKIWEVMFDTPTDGLRLLFGKIATREDSYFLSSHGIIFGDSSSLLVIRITAIIDFLTFSTYSATAVLFGTISFMGSWAFFLTFYRRYPHLHYQLALCCFFVPSLIFWGSGILKDTIVLAALGFATYCLDQVAFRKRWKIGTLLILILSLWIIYEIRRFILQAYLPSVLLWFFVGYVMKFRSLVLRILIFPVILAMMSYLGYLIVFKVGEGDSRYSLNQLARTVKITAYDIGFYTGKDAGSGYSLGELDGTFANMVQKAPLAINVALFRPYLWEVKNPLMLLAALENLVILVMLLLLIFKRGNGLLYSIRNPDVVFLLTFALTMAFAVGISSYNFGTLSRYKIALIPFFLSALVIMKSGREERNPIDTKAPVNGNWQ